jgi:hypothetical protein
VAATFGISAQEPVESTEYQLKGRAIKALAFFTEFPAGHRGNGPLLVGLMGKTPLGEILPRLFPPGSLIKGRKVVITFPKKREDAEGVDLLYIAPSERTRMAEILGWVKGKPILTVLDLTEARDLEPMVNLAIQQDKVKPEINLKVAKEAGLTFNSFLLTNSTIISR